MSETVHATAVLCGAHGVLIRGASGGGKSALAHELIARGGRLIGDDRICLSARNGRLVATVPAAISGLIELRGRGLVRLPHDPFAVIRLIVDVAPLDTLDRMPEEGQSTTEVHGIRLPFQRVPTATDSAARLVSAALEALSPSRNMGLRSA